TRQQAVTGFLAHKIRAIVSESFAPIYYSNAINAGLLLVEVPNISKTSIEDEDELEIEIHTAELYNRTKKSTMQIKPIPKPVLDIIEAGGLLELGKKMK
ncbi:MAG: 3-isopropylmalate dehydratase, partial [Candidatus Heimdallarchaeaceae archaeon]